MATLTRKQREIRDREMAILDVARAMLAERGYLGLNMDRIAEAMEYSKGTIYQHFSCKEDLLAALAVRTGEVRVEMFSRASQFNGRPRERMAAIGIAVELFVRLYTQHLHVEQVLRSMSIGEKSSEQRQQIMRSCETRCMSIVSGIIRDAMQQGDLQLPDDMKPEDLCFGLWSASYGAGAIISTSRPLLELGIVDAHAAISRNIGAMLDGYGWRPLFSEWDYDATHERILSEVFAEEAETAFSH